MNSSVLFATLLAAAGVAGAAENPAGLPVDELGRLKRQVEQQQIEIDQLKAAVAQQRVLLERVLATPGTAASPPASSDAPPASSAAATAAVLQTAPVPVSGDRPTRGEVAAETNPGGFHFSGDIRYRFDLQLRSANQAAGALQNARSRYRVRLNVDKTIAPKLRFHLQLSTGPYNNQTTNDQDFAGMAVKHPFSIAEAYADFAPSQRFAMRAGRMEEVFADNSRFLWDDDVRFNGFQQIASIPLASKPFGIRSIEFRAGEYILSNPNIGSLSVSSPYVEAGYPAGHRVGDAMLFHPGAIVRGDINARWSHFVQADMSLYHNPNEIQLSSTPAGFPVLASNAIGVQLSGPLGPVGTATRTPGGAQYYAPRWQIAHMVYRLEHKAVPFAGREMPFWLDFQASRNVGTSKLRDAFMAAANLGDVRRSGDVRFLYQFALKDANSLISQFTDDDLGTQTTTNIAVHAVRVDLGITRFLQLQNLLFVQRERRPNLPHEQMYVVLPRGANPTFRFLGQLAFTF